MKGIAFIFSMLFILQLAPAQQHGIIASSIQIGAPPGGGEGLLDTIPDAGIAYSLRKLRTGYAGDCMRIVRTSDNTTTLIGFVADTCDVGAINTFCSGTTCLVELWYDQSGNGHNAVGRDFGVNTLSLPIIYESGAVATGTGGNVAIKLTHPRAFEWFDLDLNIGDLATGIAAQPANKWATLSFVAQIGSASTQPYLWVFDQYPEGSLYYWFYETSNAVRWEFVNHGIANGGTLARDAQKSWVGVVNGTSSTAHQNNVLLGTGTTNTAINPTATGVRARMGGGSFANRNIEGYYQEVISWPSAEDPAVIWTSVDGYWGID